MAGTHLFCAPKPSAISPQSPNPPKPSTGEKNEKLESSGSGGRTAAAGLQDVYYKPAPIRGHGTEVRGCVEQEHRTTKRKKRIGTQEKDEKFGSSGSGGRTAAAGLQDPPEPPEDIGVEGYSGFRVQSLRLSRTSGG